MNSEGGFGRLDTPPFIQNLKSWIGSIVFWQWVECVLVLDKLIVNVEKRFSSFFTRCKIFSWYCEAWFSRFSLANVAKNVSVNFILPRDIFLFQYSKTSYIFYYILFIILYFFMILHASVGYYVKMHFILYHLFNVPRKRHCISQDSCSC